MLDGWAPWARGKVGVGVRGGTCNLGGGGKLMSGALCLVPGAHVLPSGSPRQLFCTLHSIASRMIMNTVDWADRKLFLQCIKVLNAHRKEGA